MLAVTVPKIRAKRPLAAEVRPRRVEQWLESLPRASARDSADRLLQTLFGQNRTALDVENRLSIMELYREPVLAAVDGLQHSYAAAGFPLSPRVLELTSLVTRLLGETANGYKIVANDLAARGRTKKPDMVLAMQRATHFLGQLLTNAYQTYSACPSGVWRELHQLYHFAEIQQLLNLPVAAPDSKSPDGLATIADSYQQIVLLGACNPYGLLQGECKHLYNLFLHWQTSVQISSEIDRKDPAGCFVINVNSDLSPVPISKAPQVRSTENLRLLNAIDVLREVHSVLRSLERDSTLPTFPSPMAHAGINSNYVDLLRRAGRFLGGIKVTRRSQRIEKDEQVEICVGVTAIHYFMNGEQRFSPPMVDGEHHQERDASIAGAADEEYIDLSKPEIGLQDKPSTSQENSTHAGWNQEVVYRLHTCRAKNESAAGMCLRVTGPTSLQLRVGDLIAVHEPVTKRWRIGAIRWLRCITEQTMDVGIEMLAPYARPVSVKSDLHPSYVQGLLLPGNGPLKLPTSLIVLRGTYRNGDRLLLVDDDQPPRPAVPIGILERTGSFSQLLLEPPPRG